MGDVSAPIFKHAVEKVFEHICAQIANMDEIIDGWAACIQTDMIFFERLEWFFFAGEVVVDCDFLHTNMVTKNAAAEKLDRLIYVVYIKYGRLSETFFVCGRKV